MHSIRRANQLELATSGSRLLRCSTIPRGLLVEQSNGVPVSCTIWWLITFIVQDLAWQCIMAQPDFSTQSPPRFLYTSFISLTA
jgi:hypothetical protein